MDPPPPAPPPVLRRRSCHRHPDEPITGFCAPCLRERLSFLDPPPDLRRCRSFSVPTSRALHPPVLPHRRSCDVRTRNTLSSLFHHDDLERNRPKDLAFLPHCEDLGFEGEEGKRNLGLEVETLKNARKLSRAFLPHCTDLGCEEGEGKKHAGLEVGTRNFTKFQHVNPKNLAFLREYEDLGFEEEGSDGEEVEIRPVRKNFGSEVETLTQKASLQTTQNLSFLPQSSHLGCEEEENDAIRAVDGEEVENKKCNGLEVEGLTLKIPPKTTRRNPTFLVGNEIHSQQSNVVGFPEKGFGGEEEEDLRPMKEHIDLDFEAVSKKPPSKDLKEIAGSFWMAASVFSKKLQKWRRKQKLRKQRGCGRSSDSTRLPVENPRSHRLFMGETQSEVGEDFLGRRSCDSGPRFSLDAGRMSLDDPRFSWDEPRASWDGYLIGGRSMLPRRDVPIVDGGLSSASVQRSDDMIPVEEDLGTRRPSATVENGGPKVASNAKVSPAVGNDFLSHLNKFERDFMDSNSKSFRNNHSDSFRSAFRDNVSTECPHKKSHRWRGWSIWGLIRMRSNSQTGGNRVERSHSKSRNELHHDVCSGRMSCSSSSVSSRHSFTGSGGFGSTRMHPQVASRRGEFVFERNRSVRCSPAHPDIGLLRFYLTPIRSSHRGSRRRKSSHSFTRNVLRLY